MINQFSYLRINHRLISFQVLSDDDDKPSSNSNDHHHNITSIDELKTGESYRFILILSEGRNDSWWQHLSHVLVRSLWQIRSIYVKKQFITTKCVGIIFPPAAVVVVEEEWCRRKTSPTDDIWIGNRLKQHRIVAYL